MTGALQNSSLELWVYAYNDQQSQEVDFAWSGGSATYEIQMPPLLELSEDYEPLSIDTLSGTVIDYMNDESSDYELLVYLVYQYESALDGSRVRYRNSWNVYNHDSDRALSFAEIPADLFGFKSAENPYSESYVSGANAAYGYMDDDLVVAWAGAALNLAIDSAKPQDVNVGARSARQRFSGKHRKTLQQEAPVILSTSSSRSSH